MKKHTTLKSKFNSAFSLVELLVVIAVIAVIAAIAIPNIANTVNQSQAAAGDRNAQSLVNTWNNYVAAVQQNSQTDYDALPTATIQGALDILVANNGLGTAVGASQPFGIGSLTTADINTARIAVPAEGSGIKTLGYNPP